MRRRLRRLLHRLGLRHSPSQDLLDAFAGFGDTLAADMAAEQARVKAIWAEQARRDSGEVW